jgi:hypothetical protein
METKIKEKQKKKTKTTKEKKKTTKELFNSKFSYLKRNFPVVDSGMDWLRLKTKDIKLKQYFDIGSSTLGENAYWGDFLVSEGKASTGKYIQLIAAISYRGKAIPIALCRILNQEKIDF